MKTHCIHLRLDAGPGYDHSDFKSVVASLSHQYIIAEEISKKEKKLHYHCHCYVNSDSKPKSVLVNFRRKLRLINKSICKSKLYAKIAKNEHDSLVYVLKDGKILFSTGIDPELLSQAQKKTDKINKDKKRDFKQKLVDYILENEQYAYPTIKQIQQAVILYHNIEGMLPPVFSLLKRYSAHISYHIIHPISQEQHLENINKLYNIN